MRIFMVLVPMTVLVIAAYFILVTAERAQDARLKAFGKYLSIWVLLLSVLLVVGAAVAPELGPRGRGFGPPFAEGRRFGGPGFAAPFARERLRQLRQGRGGNQNTTNGAGQPQGASPATPATPATPAP